MHLEIIQTKQVDESNISADLIKKLYDLSYHDEYQTRILDVDSNLIGSLKAKAAYQDHVDFLKKEWPELSIMAEKYYVLFDDPTIGSILVQEYGDGDAGVTQNQLNNVTVSIFNTDGAEYKNNANIRNFVNAKTLSDLRYLTNITSINSFLVIKDESLYNESANIFTNPSVKSLHFDSIVAPRCIFTGNADGRAFIEGNNYRSLLTFDKIDLSNATFRSAESTAHTDLPATILQAVKFDFDQLILPKDMSSCVARYLNCCYTDKFIFPEGVTKSYDNFRSCKIDYIEFPTTIKYVGDLFSEFRKDARQSWALGSSYSGSGCIVIKAKTPPECTTNTSTWYADLPQRIYVPNDSVEEYKTWASNIRFADNYTTIADLIHPFSDMSDLELELGTVTKEERGY